jgi:hypothetical protein
MSVERLREYVRWVEQLGEGYEKYRNEHGIEDEGIATFPSVALVMPGMLVSGRVVSSRGYNQQERKDLEVLHLEALALALDTETTRSIADRLTGFFREPTTEEADAILEEDYEPQTIYLREVTIIVGSREIQLPGIAIELDRVLGWKRAEFSD